MLKIQWIGLLPIIMLSGSFGALIIGIVAGAKRNELEWDINVGKYNISALEEALKMKKEYIKSLENKSTEENTITIEDCEHTCLFDGEIKCCMICGAQCNGVCNGECRRG
jgi:hypothetical protein